MYEYQKPLENILNNHIKLKLLKEMINKKKMEESIGKVCFWQSKEINI